MTGAFFGILGSIGPELRSATGIGYGGIAALFVAQTLGTVGGAAVAGVSRARVFRPLPMALAVAAALLVTLAVDAPLALLPLMFCAGFGCYAINARAQADLSLLAAGGRARALTTFHIFGGLGLAVFPVCVAALLHAGGSWHAPFVLVSALFGAYAVVSLRWQHSGDAPGLRLQAVRGIVHGRAGAALLVACLGTGVMFAVPLWIPTVMHDRFGWSTSTASLTGGLYMASLLASRITVAVLATRVDARSVLLVSAAVTVAGGNSRARSSRSRARSLIRSSAWATGMPASAAKPSAAGSRRSSTLASRSRSRRSSRRPCSFSPMAARTPRTMEKWPT